MSKYLFLFVFLIGMSSCEKPDEDLCSKIVNISVYDEPVTAHIDGEAVNKIKSRILFTYDNGNEYIVADAGEDYSSLSDMDECELMLQQNIRLR